MSLAEALPDMLGVAREATNANADDTLPSDTAATEAVRHADDTGKTAGSRNAEERSPGIAKPRSGAEDMQKEHKCGYDNKGRNLVVCIDGTGNQFGQKNSHVVELYSLLEKNEQQITWYNSGIGAYAIPSKMVERVQQYFSNRLDLAFARNFERIVCGAYRWLSDHYRQGDRIFIFGFSRGAYQARVVSAMIESVGLIHRGNEMQIPFAYDLYKHKKIDDKLCRRFKKTFSHKNCSVHFVGAWDTVSSIGIARKQELLPGTTDGMGHVCHFRHALALDERRVKFLPEYTYAGASTTEGETSVKHKRLQSVKEVWFAGTHSDIGGGNVENNLSRSMPPLRWMASEAKDVGLRMANLRNDFLANEEIVTVESLKGCWWFLEIFPIKQLSYTNSTSTTRRPHVGNGRQMRDGQKIHISVLQTQQTYIPRARLPSTGHGGLANIIASEESDDANGWLARKNIQASLTPGSTFRQHVEFNEYERARILIMQFYRKQVGGRDGQVQEGVVDTKSDEERDALFSAFIDMLKATDSDNLTVELLNIIIQHLNPAPRPTQFCYEDSSFISKGLGDTQQRQTVETFLCQFTVPIIKADSWLGCVECSQDGTRLFTGGRGGELQIWNAQTGERVPGGGKTGLDSIYSVSLSSDGKTCVVAGDVSGRDAASSIQLWRPDSEGSTFSSFSVLPLEWPGDVVLSVAVNDKGTRIVSGSKDGTVQVWDGIDGQLWRKTFAFSHTDWVRTVACSPDGATIIAGSDDGIMAMHTIPVGEAGEITSRFEPHDPGCYVLCVALSRDGRLTASGSSDGSIRIWDRKAHSTMKFEGHTDWVRSVCFSYDDALVGSGADDGTVKIWSVEQGQLVDNLVGHVSGVNSVAFFRNDKLVDGRSVEPERVVSAGSDGTIRVWVADTKWRPEITVPAKGVYDD